MSHVEPTKVAHSDRPCAHRSRRRAAMFVIVALEVACGADPDAAASTTERGDADDVAWTLGRRSA